MTPQKLNYIALKEKWWKTVDQKSRNRFSIMHCWPRARHAIALKSQSFWKNLIYLGVETEINPWRQKRAKIEWDPFEKILEWFSMQKPTIKMYDVVAANKKLARINIEYIFCSNWNTTYWNNSWFLFSFSNVNTSIYLTAFIGMLRLRNSLMRCFIKLTLL